jgi:thiamine kinase-like enzyme
MSRNTYVAKIPDEGSGPTIDPRAEFDLLEHLSAKGLTPKPAACDTKTGIVFTEHLFMARPWRLRDVREPRNVARAAVRLRQLHETATTSSARELPEFDALSFVRRYFDGLPGNRAAAAARRIVDEAELLAMAYDGIEESDVVCHNDLVAANILDDGVLRFVDFEYAVRARPVVDLASLVAMNDLNAVSVSALLGEYYCGEVPFDRRAFDGVVRLQRLIAQAWQLGRSPDRGVGPSS